jgi:hypothetical protein
MMVLMMMMMMLLMVVLTQTLVQLGGETNPRGYLHY